MVKNAKLCYMNTDSFIVHVKIENIYKDIAEDVETRFDISNFELDRSLSKEKTKKVIGLMKDELGRKIMKEFVGLRAKTYGSLKDNDDEGKKAKETKKCVMKRKLKFKGYSNCLEAAQIKIKINHLEKNKIDADSLKEDHKEFIKNDKLILKTQQRLRSEKHNVFSKKLIRLIVNDKRIQSFDSIETHAYGMSKDLKCKAEEIKCNNIIKEYKNV